MEVKQKEKQSYTVYQEQLLWSTGIGKMKISSTILEEDESGKPGYIMIEVYYTLVNWVEGRLVFWSSKGSIQRTEPDGFNYFLELFFFFFLLEKKYKTETVQQVLGICWGQLFLQKVKKTIKGVAILDLLLTSRHKLAESGRELGESELYRLMITSTKRKRKAAKLNYLFFFFFPSRKQIQTSTSSRGW